LIEKSYESAIVDVFQVRIIAAGVWIRTPTYDGFKRLPGDFDQPFLRCGRDMNVGHDDF